MIDVVVTTISDGSFLKRWGELIEQAGRDDVRLVVIPDLNTPDLSEIVKDVQMRGINIECPHVEEQEAFLRKLGDDSGFIPWRSDNRRNVGFLLSWRDGADVMISVDDDNFPADVAWFDDHAIVTASPSRHLGATGGWFNPYALLDMTQPAYARGFPYFARGTLHDSMTYKTEDVAINAGLWLGDPDVDAVTRLATSPVSIRLEGRPLVIGQDCWAPVNSQNTAIRRDVIPAYWFARMPDWGGRMGDIFSGYFAEACAKHLGHAVRFGTPLVTQERNHHDLLADLELETPFYRLLEEFLGWLPGVKLEGSTYRDAYESLSLELGEFADTKLYALPWHVFLRETASRMRYWLGLCDQIGRQ